MNIVCVLFILEEKMDSIRIATKRIDATNIMKMLKNKFKIIKHGWGKKSKVS